MRGAELCLDCYCPANGKCDLQRYGIDYEVFKNRFHGGEAHDYPADFRHDFIMREPNRCINCGRCVRVCRMEVGSSCYDNMGRGYDTIVSTADNLPLQMVGCVSLRQVRRDLPHRLHRDQPAPAGELRPRREPLHLLRRVRRGLPLRRPRADRLLRARRLQPHDDGARVAVRARAAPRRPAARDRHRPRAARARLGARQGLDVGAHQGRSRSSSTSRRSGADAGRRLPPWFFFILAVWILVCGLGVVAFKKVMYSAVSMVFCFLGVAFAYALLNAPLVAVIQVLVYVGAISDRRDLRDHAHRGAGGRARPVLQPADRLRGAAGDRRGRRGHA